MTKFRLFLANQERGTMKGGRLSRGGLGSQLFCGSAPTTLQLVHQARHSAEEPGD
jgi:hypothetical protein